MFQSGRGRSVERKWKRGKERALFNRCDAFSLWKNLEKAGLFSKQRLIADIFGLYLVIVSDL